MHSFLNQPALCCFHQLCCLLQSWAVAVCMKASNLRSRSPVPNCDGVVRAGMPCWASALSAHLVPWDVAPSWILSRHSWLVPKGNADGTGLQLFLQHSALRNVGDLVCSVQTPALSQDMVAPLLGHPVCYCDVEAVASVDVGADAPLVRSGLVSIKAPSLWWNHRYRDSLKGQRGQWSVRHRRRRWSIGKLRTPFLCCHLWRRLGRWSCCLCRR